MTDQEQPFGVPYVPQPPTEQAPAQAKPASRRARGGRRPTRPAAPKKATAKPVPTRKPRVETPSAHATRATRIDLGLAVTAFAGLSEPAANALASIARIIDAQPKRMRRLIATAIGKLFP